MHRVRSPRNLARGCDAGMMVRVRNNWSPLNFGLSARREGCDGHG